MNRAPIPGSASEGWVEPAFVAFRPEGVFPPGVRSLVAWRFGGCLVVRFLDREGVHLTVSRDDRYPTWDEVKTARYRLLPLNRCFALLLPPPAEYQDDPINPRVFELTEVPWPLP